MHCEQAEMSLASLLFDELDGAAKAELNAHLSSCLPCSEKLGDLRVTVNLLRQGLTAEPAPRLPAAKREALLEKLAAPPVKVKRKGKKKRKAKQQPVPRLTLAGRAFRGWLSQLAANKRALLFGGGAIAAAMVLAAGLMLPPLGSPRYKASPVAAAPKSADAPRAYADFDDESAQSNTSSGGVSLGEGLSDVQGNSRAIGGQISRDARDLAGASEQSYRLAAGGDQQPPVGSGQVMFATKGDSSNKSAADAATKYRVPVTNQSTPMALDPAAPSQSFAYGTQPGTGSGGGGGAGADGGGAAANEHWRFRQAPLNPAPAQGAPALPRGELDQLALGPQSGKRADFYAHSTLPPSAPMDAPPAKTAAPLAEDWAALPAPAKPARPMAPPKLNAPEPSAPLNPSPAAEPAPQPPRKSEFDKPTLAAGDNGAVPSGPTHESLTRHKESGRDRGVLFGNGQTAPATASATPSPSAAAGPKVEPPPPILAPQVRGYEQKLQEYEKSALEKRLRESPATPGDGTMIAGVLVDSKAKPEARFSDSDARSKGAGAVTLGDDLSALTSLAREGQGQGQGQSLTRGANLGRALEDQTKHSLATLDRETRKAGELSRPAEEWFDQGRPDGKPPTADGIATFDAPKPVVPGDPARSESGPDDGFVRRLHLDLSGKLPPANRSGEEADRKGEGREVQEQLKSQSARLEKDEKLAEKMELEQLHKKVEPQRGSGGGLGQADGEAGKKRETRDAKQIIELEAINNRVDETVAAQHRLWRLNEERRVASEFAERPNADGAGKEWAAFSGEKRVKSAEDVLSRLSEGEKARDNLIAKEEEAFKQASRRAEGLASQGEATIPYNELITYPGDWPELTASRLSTALPALNQRVAQKLSDRLPASIEGNKLASAIDQLRNTTGVNFFVNWDALEAAGVERDAAVALKADNQSAEQALRSVLQTLNKGGLEPIDYAIVDGVVHISTKRDLQAAPDTRAYDVNDLLPTPANKQLSAEEQQWRQRDVAGLVEKLQAAVGTPQQWQSRELLVREVNGNLVLRARGEQHEQMVTLLGVLRAKPAAAAVQEDDASPLQPSANFKSVPVNPWELAAEDRFSTFALDVDTASYTLCRKYIRRGFLPPVGAVRMEEFVNAFDYNYPTQAEGVFTVLAEAAPAPFGPGDGKTVLLKVAVRGKVIGRDGRKPANLVLVVDASGSMARPDRLPMVKYALGQLARQLKPADTVSLIAFGSQAYTLLDRVPASQVGRIVAAVEAIQPSGPTNLLRGVQAAYQLAEQAHRAGSINRLILCSDGIATLGETEADSVRQYVERYRREGIALTSVGFGSGAYDDEMLETLANKGDGAYYFVDSKREADRVFIDELTATLQTIAKDAKIQVEFNPQRVRRYRLIGYENRAVADKDFRNDAIDAGEVGSGQSSTALYEVELMDGAGYPGVPGNEVDIKAGLLADLGTVYVRYRNTDTDKVEEISQRLGQSLMADCKPADRPRLFLAACAAEFAELLRDSEHARGGSLARLQDVLDQAVRHLPLDEKAAELLELVRKAQGLPRAP